MPRNMRFFQFCFCCPGDVIDEKKIIERLCDDWNRQHGRHRNVLIDVVHWLTDAYPELGNHPQDIINRQIIDQSDVLIGIFWTRFGSPTRKADSGTEEEIRRFIEHKKPAIVYFSAAPVPPDRVDMSQYDKVKQFKKELEGNGLCFTYRSLEDFEELFRRHLAARMASLLERVPPPILTELRLNLQQLAFTIQYLQSSSLIDERFVIPRRPDESETMFDQRQRDSFQRCVSLFFDPAFLQTNVQDVLFQANAQTIANLAGNQAAVVGEAYGYIREAYSHIGFYKKLIEELNVPRLGTAYRKERSEELIHTCLIKMRREWMQSLRCWLYLEPEVVDVEGIRSGALSIILGTTPGPDNLRGEEGWKYAGYQAAEFQHELTRLANNESRTFLQSIEEQQQAEQKPVTDMDDALSRAKIAYLEGKLELVRHLLNEAMRFPDNEGRLEQYVGASLQFLADPERFDRTLGVYVLRIDSEGRGYQAGLRANDVIVRYRGTAVRDPWHLSSLSSNPEDVSNVPMEIIRGSVRMSLLVRGGVALGATGTNLICFERASI